MVNINEKGLNYVGL